MSDKTKDILEWIVCVIVAVVLAVVIRYFVGTPTVVKQVSMFPTLKQNDRLILNRLTRTTKTMPNRGDIITFEAPLEQNEYLKENVIAPYDNQEDWSFVKKFVFNVLEMGKISYIKRVIALPGEHIEIKDGAVYIDGKMLVEDYLGDDVLTTSLGGGEYVDLIVPDNCVFAMGDNRPGSKDSRYFGCIPLEKIESKVVIRFWPLNVFGKVK